MSLWMYVHKMTCVHMSTLYLSVMYACNVRGKAEMKTLISVLKEDLHHPEADLLAFNFVGNFTKSFPFVIQRILLEGCYLRESKVQPLISSMAVE